MDSSSTSARQGARRAKQCGQPVGVLFRSAGGLSIVGRSRCWSTRSLAYDDRNGDVLWRMCLSDGAYALDPRHGRRVAVRGGDGGIGWRSDLHASGVDTGDPVAGCAEFVEAGVRVPLTPGSVTVMPEPAGNPFRRS